MIHIKPVICVAVFLLVTPTYSEAMVLQAPRSQQPRTASRNPPKPQPPLTLRQVIESLSSLRSSARVEALISRRGIQFIASPEVLAILKEFGAGPKLLDMIPKPPLPPPPPPPKVAGNLTVICEPEDCAVVVNDLYRGMTSGNRVTVQGLQVGEATMRIFSEGYEDVTRTIQLREGEPHEEKVTLKRNAADSADKAKAALLETVAILGGIEGMAELADIEGTGTMRWTDSDEHVQEWTVFFNKRVGKNLVMTFKTREGQCTASVVLQAGKQECRGELRNGGEKIAGQAASLFLSYQLQDVIQELLTRMLIVPDTDEKQLESSGEIDTYVLTVEPGGLPADLVYRINSVEDNAPIRVQYSNYMNLNKGRYPGRIAIGRLNAEPVWIFTFDQVRSNVIRASSR
jgi:hypothetical protein